MKYEATVTETTTYRMLIIADSEDDARANALAMHEEGVDTEIDSGPVEVESITLLGES